MTCVAYNNVFRFLCGEPRNSSLLVTCLYLEDYLHARCLGKVYIYGFMISVYHDIYEEVMQYNIAEHCCQQCSWETFAIRTCILVSLVLRVFIA